MVLNNERYEQSLERFKDGIPCPDDFSFPSVVDKWAKEDANLVAIHWVASDFTSELKITYTQLADESNRLAVAFESRGIKRGSRVMIVLPKVVEWFTAVIALMRIGAVPIPGTSLLVGSDLSFRAQSSECIAFIGDDAACGRFEPVAAACGIALMYQVRTPIDGGVKKGRVDFAAEYKGVAVGTIYIPDRPPRSSDLCILYFTSGTTGYPKQVLLESRYTQGHTLTALWYRLTKGTLFLTLADMGWAKASYWVMGAFNAGATLFCQPPPAGTFDPLHLLETLHRYPIEVCCAPPTVYRSLCTTASIAYYNKNPPRALGHCIGAGEPLNASVIDVWKKITGGIEIKDGYGQSETAIVVGNFYGIPVRPGSMGKTAPGVQVAILGPMGVLGDGEEGEIVVRTDEGGGKHWIFKGYVKDGKIDKREKTFAGKTWYCTGDRAFRDADGYYWFVGRADDVISSAGYRIGPFEVESTLKKHPAVLESAVVASPHAERGEIVKAFIILSAEYQGLSPTQLVDLVLELQTVARKESSPYKYPREIEFVADLPKTISGKIRRVELRDLEYERKKEIVRVLRAKL